MPTIEKASAEFVWKEIKAALEQEQERIYHAITDYPSPIPACDEQFNYLLEKRAQVSRDLARAEAAVKTQPSLAACRKFVDELAATSSFITDETARRLRSLMDEVVV